MLGSVSGVGVQFARVSPFLTYILRVALRCTLVASNTAQCINKISDFLTTVNGVYKLLEYAAAWYERLRQLHAALDR